MKKIAIACLFGLGLAMVSGCDSGKKADDKGGATTATAPAGGDATKPADAPK